MFEKRSSHFQARKYSVPTIKLMILVRHVKSHMHTKIKEVGSVYVDIYNLMDSLYKSIISTFFARSESAS